MTDFKNKRLDRRYPYKADVEFYIKDSPCVHYLAQVTNYSVGGLYFESNESVDVGQQVILRIKNYYAYDSKLEDYEMYSGRVQWTNLKDDTGSEKTFGLGIQYEEAKDDNSK